METALEDREVDFPLDIGHKDVCDIICLLQIVNPVEGQGKHLAELGALVVVESHLGQKIVLLKIANSLQRCDEAAHLCGEYSVWDRFGQLSEIDECADDRNVLEQSVLQNRVNSDFGEINGQFLFGLFHSGRLEAPTFEM